jgi:FlgD Ig-like domain
VSQKRTGYLVIAVLLAASGVAFLRAEQLKLQHSPVGAVQIQKVFSTTCPLHGNTRCRTHFARLSFRLRDAGRVALAIVDGSGNVVERLGPAGGSRHGRGRITLRWDGRTASGATAADGTYHLRVGLPDLNRTITIPDPIGLDNTAPSLTLVGRPGHLPLRYRTTEAAVVFVHAHGVGGDAGRAALFRGHGGKVHFRRTRLAGAQVRITLVAVDPAGNASAPLDAGVIRLPA